MPFVRGHMHRCLDTGATAYSWPIFPQPPAHTTCERARVMYNVRPYMSKFVRCFGVTFMWNQSSGELLLQQVLVPLISRPVTHYQEGGTAPIAEPGRLSR